MRVAMVSEHASPLAVLGGVDAGGQNVHVAALAAALARRDVEVVVHTRRDDADLPARVELAPGVTVHHVDAGPPRPIPKDDLPPHMPDFARELRAAWRAEPPDVVHAHFWMSGMAALAATSKTDTPVVQTFHALGIVKRRYQGDKDTSPPERLATERRIVGAAAHVVATCTDEAFELMRLGADRERLTVVPCGVDLKLFRPDGPAAPRHMRMRRLLCVGRLVERKGVGNAITALADLPGTELLIAGGPDARDLGRDPEARRLRSLAADHGVADRVVLLGRVSRADLPALMRSADAVVAVPWYEPFGIVPLEAMACGVPVVASAVGGMIDTVVDGVTGLHVPPRDPERLARALDGLLADADRRARLGAGGVRRARQLFDWERVSHATHDVYRQLAAARGRRPARGASMVAAAGRGRFRRVPAAAEHLGALSAALGQLTAAAPQLEDWGARLAVRLLEGGRVLAVGNGGSAAQAEHFTAELVGRYVTERTPLSAICLHADAAALTAIGNDYGPEAAFARQVRAHGRHGDVLLALSTSGASANVLAAAGAAREGGLEVWGLTGRAPNPLAAVCDEVLAVDAAETATVQELHLVALHVLCGALARAVAATARRPLAARAAAGRGERR
ncbi:MAG TPA: glycosyltransferase [Solirubrobacteraceae bacterium]|nr:glycosyltransferase [Solirubrobacteraceae bacterium]